MSEYYEESRNKSIDRTDRYKNCKILKDKDTGEYLLSTREIIQIPTSPSDTYHRVKSHEATRLDMIANEYYRNPLLWWVIAQANNIKDPIDVIAPGTVLRIPSIESLYGTGGILL